MSRWSLVGAAVALLSARNALAQSRRDDEATIRADPYAAARARIEGGTGFATSIDLRTQGLVRGSVGEMLDEAPGLQVRRLGDAFSPQSVTLRGAPAAHVTVALDGVVLNDAASDGVDLSVLPPMLLARADVYRGSSPLRLGAAGLGGAVELITRENTPGATSWLMAGGGSFGARRVGAFLGSQRGRWSTLAAVSVRSSEGDFPFYDDRGTPLLPGVTSTRENNAGHAVDLLARACHGEVPSPARSPCVLLLTGWRMREVPGLNGFQTDGPFAEQRRVLTRVTAPITSGALRVEPWVSAMVREDTFANEGARILPATTPSVTRSLTWLTELGATVTIPEGRWRLEAGARGRAEGFVPISDDATTATRQGVLAWAELTARGATWELHPGLSLEAWRDARGDASGARALFGPRMGASWRATSWLTLRANGGVYQRAPTLPELYGDRGVITGNPSLRPERSLNADLGAVLSATRGEWSVRAELAGYARAVDDQIALVQTTRSTFRPDNLDHTRVYGVESQLRVMWARRASLTVAYALTDATLDAPGSAIDGRRVPGLSQHDLSASIDVQAGRAHLGVTTSYLTESFLDVANLAEVPARWLADVTAQVPVPRVRGLRVLLAVTNVFDARTVTRRLLTPAGEAGAVTSPLADWFGFPLPGRAFFAALQYSTGP